MYPLGIYYSFVQLRKQLYKLKTQEQIDKYSKIEFYKKYYKTFRRFSDECEEYFSIIYRDEPTDQSIQEIFDHCLELSGKGILKKSCY